MITCCSAHNEVFREIDAADTVEPADEWLSRCLVDTRNNRAHEVGSEPSFVQTRADEVGHSLWADVPLLAQAVHVDFVAEEIRDGGYVGCETCETQEDISVLEYLREVVGDGEGLHAEAEIAGDGNAILAHHGNTGAAVYYALECRVGKGVKRIRTY